jgi:hypothetical protein
MGTKRQPGTYDCWSNLEVDEPYFVIAGRDPAAATLVRMWMFSRKELIRQGKKPKSDYALVEEARAVADAMELFSVEWQHRKGKPQ